MEVFNSFRWAFENANGIEDVEAKQALKDAVSDFWKAFEEHQEDILFSFSDDPKIDVVNFMGFYLQSIHPQISWEFGPGINGKELRLVMTPEEHVSLRPFVDYIVSAAPELEKWEFYNRRPKENMDNTRLLVEAKTGSVLEPMKFSASINEFNEIDLVFVGDEVKDQDDVDFILNQAFVVAECMLGEELMDKWIGFIDSASSVEVNIQLQEITSLEEFVNGLISQVRDSQFDFQSIAKDSYKAYQLDPQDFADYPAQGDLQNAKTAYPQMWENAHNGESFYSERYAKEGKFAYLKVEKTEGTGSFSSKEELGESLNSALLSQQLGGVMGNGEGKKYYYHDLYLKDVPTGIDTITTLLGDKGLTKRAWIHFYDSELAEEWVGVSSESPQPYLPSEVY